MSCFEARLTGPRHRDPRRVASRVPCRGPAGGRGTGRTRHAPPGRVPPRPAARYNRPLTGAAARQDPPRPELASRHRARLYRNAPSASSLRARPTWHSLARRSLPVLLPQLEERERLLRGTGAPWGGAGASEILNPPPCCCLGVLPPWGVPEPRRSRAAVWAPPAGAARIQGRKHLRVTMGDTLKSHFKCLKKKSSFSLPAGVEGNLLHFIWKHSSNKLHVLKVGQVA
ncbi:uncharacterized protein LOC128911703 [Rissa tridactyla]|uniref:uncharacterized protein LOC128911703 n=1 Tax=Rissa tridactyla TaxID=75485 RepID=UPI0023BA52AC|nr:uncharacterized protein LOC128911703 [Rissa tridactyla]